MLSAARPPGRCGCPFRTLRLWVFGVQTLGRETETDRDRQRQAETDRDRQRQTDTDRHRQTDRQVEVFSLI